MAVRATAIQSELIAGVTKTPPWSLRYGGKVRPFDLLFPADRGLVVSGETPASLA